MERQPMDQEKIAANDMNDKVLTSKIYKQLIQLNIKRKNPNQTTESQDGQEPYTDISPKKTTRWPTGT